MIATFIYVCKLNYQQKHFIAHIYIFLLTHYWIGHHKEYKFSFVYTSTLDKRNSQVFLYGNLSRTTSWFFCSYDGYAVKWKNHKSSLSAQYFIHENITWKSYFDDRDDENNIEMKPTLSHNVMWNIVNNRILFKQKQTH